MLLVSAMDYYQYVRERRDRPPHPHGALSAEEQFAYARLEAGPAFAAARMQAAWQRTVRHNRRIEREVLWFTVYIERDCRFLVNRPARGRFLARPLSDATKRYDLEAAIRTIPELIPFTENECQAVRNSQQPRDLFFYADGYENEVEGIALHQPALVARWHQWLWAPKRNKCDHAHPNPEAEVLAAGYRRVGEAMLGAAEEWRDP